MTLFLTNFLLIFVVFILITLLLFVLFLNLGILPVPMKHKWIKRLLFRKTILEEENLLEEFENILYELNEMNIDYIMGRLNNRDLIDYSNFKDRVKELCDQLDRAIVNPIDPLFNVKYKKQYIHLLKLSDRELSRLKLYIMVMTKQILIESLKFSPKWVKFNYCLNKLVKHSSDNILSDILARETDLMMSVKSNSFLLYAN